MTFLFITLAVVLYVAYWYLARPKNLPPGPLGIPIFGYLPFLGKKSHVTICKLAEKYGSVMHMYLGSMNVIVLNDYAVLKEAFVKQSDIFSERRGVTVVDGKHKVDFPLLAKFFHNGTGIIHSTGHVWKELRRFSLIGLREMGFGKRSLQDKIHEEVKAFLEELRQKDGQPFDMLHLITNSVSNVICSIVFGERFEYEDEDFKQLMQALNVIFRNMSLTSAPLYISILRFWPPALMNMKPRLNAVRILQKFVAHQIAEHRKTFDPSSPRDFIDVYLIEQQEQLAKGNEDSVFASENQLNKVIFDLFAAGTETTSTSIMWHCAYLINNPDLQRKVQEEIDSVVGHGRLPRMEDQPNMPYTEATILEIMRVANAGPYGLLHSTADDTELYGYYIPKRSTVIANLYRCHLDPKYFPEPHQIKPERFLDKSGKVMKNPEGFVPFSLGRRVCLGENLARMELFLFMSAMLQNFTFKPPQGQTEIDTEPEYGLALSLKECNFVAVPRLQ